MSGSLGERELAVGTLFHFFYKITRRKLRCRNSFLYQSVNSPFRSRRRMGWRTIIIVYCCE